MLVMEQSVIRDGYPRKTGIQDKWIEISNTNFLKQTKGLNEFRNSQVASEKISCKIKIIFPNF
jgi:hypothetical protein